MTQNLPISEIPTPLVPKRIRSGTGRRVATLRAVMALILREMSSTYGRSPGGYVWALLEPLGAIAMFTLVFSVGLSVRVPSLGMSFPLFFASGMLPFLMYRGVSTKVATSLTFSRSLLLYPSVTFVDAILARLVLQILTHCMVFTIFMGAIITVFDTRALLDLPPILAALTMSAAIGLGVGMINALLFPLFPLWKSLWSIVTTPLLFMSTVIYIFEDLPPSGRELLWWNPLVHVIGMMRRGIYGDYDASWVSPFYVFALSGLLTVLGLVLLGRYQRNIVNQDFD